MNEEEMSQRGWFLRMFTRIKGWIVTRINILPKSGCKSLPEREFENDNNRSIK